jgi:hypothetical protein
MRPPHTVTNSPGADQLSNDCAGMLAHLVAYVGALFLLATVAIRLGLWLGLA